MSAQGRSFDRSACAGDYPESPAGPLRIDSRGCQHLLHRFDPDQLYFGLGDRPGPGKSFSPIPKKSQSPKKGSGIVLSGGFTEWVF